MTAIQVPFDEKENERMMKARHMRRLRLGLPTEPLNIVTDEPEPLRMEHFHLPLGIWFVGLLISLFCFLAEIIIKWITKRKAVRLSDTEGAEVDLAVDLAGGSTQH